MKNRYILIALITSALVIGCEQEVPQLTPPEEITSGEPGSADFTMFVSLGNSLTAGFQGGALFNEGQENSFPAIMAKQFAMVSVNNPFDQPDINSVNGYNSTYSNPGGGIFRGRMILFDPDGPGPKTPVPAPAGTPGMPAPYNNVSVADLPSAYTGDKDELNNFGVPGILLTQVHLPETGNPASEYYNPLWARFASAPGAKSILQDAIDKSPTFFSFWLGNNDVLGFATSGGLGTMTDPESFEDDYRDAIEQLLAVSENTKGIVATIPDVTTIPFFTTVKYNAIPLDAATVAQLNSAAGFGGYNAAVEGLKNPAFGGAFGTAAQLDARKVVYAEGNNPILIADKAAINLGPGFDLLLQYEMITQDQRNALAPYERVRQATAEDIITLSAGAVLGTLVGGNPLYVNGVTVPLADQYVLLPSEIEAIKTRTTAFNNIIKGIAADFPNDLAVADINAKFTSVVNLQTVMVDGIPVNATFAPPAGLFSPDGVHPNNRGSAFIARVFIEAINAKFGSTVPLPNIATYHTTGLPVNPVAP